MMIALWKNRKYLWVIMLCVSAFNFLFASVKLFVTLDSSGPVIALDTRSAACRANMLAIRSAKTDLHLPRYTPTELLTSGLLYGNFFLIYYFPIHNYSYNHLSHILQNHQYHNLFLDVGNVAISLHISGHQSLNNDPACTLLMENVMVHFYADYYTLLFIFNRFLYSKFFFTLTDIVILFYF